LRLNSELTAPQQQILVLLAQGKTMNAAAEAANIHRNTIANWRRSSEAFRNEWHSMQYEQAMHWRDQLQSIAQVAVDAILKTLTDEKTPPSVRLRAALAVLDKVTAVAPAQPELHRAQPAAAESMHNHAQPETEPRAADSTPEPEVPAQSCTTPEPDFLNDFGQLDGLLEEMCRPPRMHNGAQASPHSGPGA
jgi:hypothetical protein